MAAGAGLAFASSLPNLLVLLGLLYWLLRLWLRRRLPRGRWGEAGGSGTWEMGRPAGGEEKAGAEKERGAWQGCGQEQGAREGQGEEERGREAGRGRERGKET